MENNSLKILDVKIDQLNRKEARQRVIEIGESCCPGIIFTPNPEMVMKAQNDHDLRQIINQKNTLNIADGTGILWAGRFLTLNTPGQGFLRYLFSLCQCFLTLMLLPFYPRYFYKPVPERITGADFIWDLAEICAKKKWRLYLLGGGPTVAERCALTLQTKIPELRVAGVNSADPEDAKDSCEIIKRSKADVVAVAYGIPKQEKWLAENLNETGAKIGIGVGGTFDYLAGFRPRSPLWVQRLGFEWLYRLIVEPRRWRRQLALPKFIWAVFKAKVAK